jgi:hypothetical protein
MQLGDLLGCFYSFVSWFSLDFLTFDGLSDITRACCSRGAPLFLVHGTCAHGLARVVLE